MLLEKDINSQMRQKRARTQQDKAQKRESILHTASTLFNQSPSALPTAAAIASASGIAKGTVYLYFKSKEAIFLALLKQHYQIWFADITAAVETETVDANNIINAICQYVEKEPQFFQLASLSHSIIEKNVAEDDLRLFKSSLSKMVMLAATHLATKLQLDDNDLCAKLLMRSYAILLGIWQISNHHADQSKKNNTDIRLDILEPEFGLEARNALLQLWQGHLSKENKSGRFWKLSNLFG